MGVLLPGGWYAGQLDGWRSNPIEANAPTGSEHKRGGMSEFTLTEAGSEYRAGNDADIDAVFLHDGKFLAPSLHTCLQCAEVAPSTCGGSLNSGSEAA